MENQDVNEKNGLQIHAPKFSIQDAFKKFQKEKFYQLKLNKYLKNNSKDKKSSQFKQQLREKFIETAKKYIGIPYAEKYHQPGDELYGAPLYLDCCGLIRQVVFDLRQQFGYTLAKWNQSYQFDLLPDEGLVEKDLKPGDLIFYSATYTNTKLKPFPHQMVHVEIYLGEGKSIGARWQKGTIQVFQSYKFQSKLYHSIKFHFRSIDKWLEGIFESHCSEHKWLDDRNNEWVSDKFSVFADPALDDISTSTQIKQEVKNIFIGKGNNSKLIREFFEKQEKYCILPDRQQFNPHFYFKWVQSTGEVDFYSFKENQQIVNHIPNISIISSKLQLLKTLKEAEMEAESKGYNVTKKMDQFVPKTYRLDVMSDQISFLNDETPGFWIYKPRNLNQGKGIKMIENIKQFKKQFISSKKFYLGEFSLRNMLYYHPDLLQKTQQTKDVEKKQENEANRYEHIKHEGLIQHYIQPFLLGGRKFDIRCYMFINSVPSVVLFNRGYLRLTIDKYDEQDLENEQKLMIHLTNNCYQARHKEYKDKKQLTIGKWEMIEEQIGKQATRGLIQQIKKILWTTYLAAQRKLIKKRGTYELLGCDVLISRELKPYLLEINTNPAMFTQTAVQKEIIPPLISKTLKIALNLFEQPEKVIKMESQDPNSIFEQFSQKLHAKLEKNQFQII